MEWKEDHDILLCREILLSRPYQFKERTVERGRVWGEIAERLNGSQAPVFRVTKSSVRDRFKILTHKYKREMRDEEKASGIEVEPQSELEQLLEHLITEEETAVEQMEFEGSAKRKKMENDKLKAEEIRRLAMEKVGETRKRKDADDDERGTARRKRRGGDPTFELVKERSERDYQLRQQELQQNAQRQDQLQQMMLLMQQQTQAMLAFMHKGVPK